MSNREWFEIAPGQRERIEALGLASFAALMDGDAGDIISRDDGGREVRRIAGPAGDDGCYFLKRRRREPLLPQLAVWLRSGKLHSGPVREALMVACLREAGFATMEPLAWGENRCCCIPKGGFYLSRGVPGVSLAVVFESSRGPARSRSMHQLGLLVGRLHARGFLHPVRLKDVIERPDGELVLIDRETGKPWPRRFNRSAALAILARAARRTLRDGHRPAAGSTSQFLRGYHHGVATTWNVGLRELARGFLRRLRRELR